MLKKQFTIIINVKWFSLNILIEFNISHILNLNF